MTSRRLRRGAMTAALIVLSSGLVVGAAASPPDSSQDTGSPADGHPALTPLEGSSATTTLANPPSPPMPADYVQREYFLDGAARSFSPDTRGQRVPYRTRILVRTPKEAAAFSGTVMVEWLNVSGQLETDPDYGEGQAEVHRKHHAWVGVSAQQVGVQTQIARDPARYSSLSHPGDDYSFDIFSQVGYLLKNPGAVDALAGLRTRPDTRSKKAAPADLRLFGSGNSQSGRRLTMYIQNGGLRYAGAYDGLLVTATNPNSAGGSTTYPAPYDVPSVPVLTMQSEGEAAPPVATPERPTGRYESPLYRLWYVTGTSHVDNWALVNADDQHRGQYGELRGPGGNCVVRPNQFPKRYAYDAAIRALDVWMRTGTPAPQGSELQYNAAGALTRDADGNAIGGVRLAPMDVPLAEYVGGSCAVLGHTTTFPDAKLRERYPTHADYMTKLRAAINGDIADRFMVPEDATDLISRAEAAAVRWEGTAQP